MTKWLAMMVACLALGLVVAGCGGDDDDSSDSGASAQTTEQTDTGGATTEDTTTEESTEDSGGAAADEAEVKMQNIQFDPKDVSIAAGGTVKWSNEDSAPHDVTKTDGPGGDFASGQGNMQKGDTFEHTFADAGTYQYECTVHPGMTGTVNVK